MTREEKLTKIYEVIADKTLSFGCKLQMQEGGEFGMGYYINEDELFLNQSNRERSLLMPDEGRDYTIIGHPIMIGDVLDWAKYSKRTMLTEYNNGYKLEGSNSWVGDLLIDWELPRKPIDDQSGDCIDFVYNLVKHGKPN